MHGQSCFWEVVKRECAAKKKTTQGWELKKENGWHVKFLGLIYKCHWLAFESNCQVFWYRYPRKKWIICFIQVTDKYWIFYFAASIVFSCVLSWKLFLLSSLAIALNLEKITQVKLWATNTDSDKSSKVLNAELLHIIKVLLLRSPSTILLLFNLQQFELLNQLILLHL